MASISRFRRWRLILVGLGLAGASRVPACGPFFPNTYLSNSLDELTTLPALSFERELERLTPEPRRKRPPTVVLTRQLAEAERAEVREALAREGLTEKAIEAALADFRREDPPAALPPEFQLYAHGAKAWHANRRDEALAAWRELLALPPHERHYRTVWAAYMMGRAHCEADSDLASKMFELAERSAARGFADSQHLAEASVGWMGQIYLRHRQYDEALTCYLQQFAAGDPSALTSIQMTLQRVFNLDATIEGDPSEHHERGAGDETTPDAALQALASDAKLRPVVTAWFAARGGPSLSWGAEARHAFVRWIHGLPAAKDLSPEEADRWSWAAYQNGLWSEAGALAAHAPADAPASEWVRAMLLLRSGLVDAAAVHLAKAARSFPADRALAEPTGESTAREVESPPELQPLGDSPGAQLAGVRGMLALRSERYAEALRVFLAAGHATDAAYVAERVLTIDELIAFVRAEVPTPPLSKPNAAWGEEELDLRHLLARRLVRLGRFDDAAEFFPSALKATYRDYVTAVRAGRDAGRAASDRAHALWVAAQIVYEKGMELQGTALEPDFELWGGDYTWPDIAKERGHDIGVMGESSGDSVYWRRTQDDEGLGATADELDRLKTAKVPAHRFHYRYRATELAWLAAGLLPNDDAETAMILNQAGCWIAHRDPEAAQLFYTTLVVRCANTELGRQAAKAHWLVWPTTAVSRTD